jgi:hypothetical protein
MKALRSFKIHNLYSWLIVDSGAGRTRSALQRRHVQHQLTLGQLVRVVLHVEVLLQRRLGIVRVAVIVLAVPRARLASTRRELFGHARLDRAVLVGDARRVLLQPLQRQLEYGILVVFSRQILFQKSNLLN